MRKLAIFRFKLEEAASDSKMLFSLQSAQLNRQDKSDYLPDMTPQEVAESVSRLFHEKIEKIKPDFVDEPSQESEGKEHHVSHVLMNTLSRVRALSGDSPYIILCG